MPFRGSVIHEATVNFVWTGPEQTGFDGVLGAVGGRSI